MKHLWEENHAYYCNDSNWDTKGCFQSFKSWPGFLREEGSADLDLNLVFRWDWDAPREDDCDDESPFKWEGDENYRDCTLKLYYMGQRRGLFRIVHVDVCRADEPSVREWLQVRMDHLAKLWAPMTPSPENGMSKETP